MKNVKGDLKMIRKYWDLIVSGDKEYELRKLSKGLVEGWYRVVSVDVKYVKVNEGEGVVPVPKYVYGFIYLRPMLLFHINSKNHPFKWWTIISHWSTELSLDSETILWVRENYLGKVEFVAYKIKDFKIDVASEVKRLNESKRCRTLKEVK